MRLRVGLWGESTEETVIPRIVLGRVLPLVAISIASTLPLSSKDKMKIEIVDTASTIEVGTTTSSVPASPARSVTHCSGISGIYAKVYGYDCTTTNHPEMPAHDVNKPYIASSYYARAVMPDGAHVWLTCDLIAKRCAPIDPWSPAQTRETCDNQPSATALYLRVCLRINSETKTLGFYGATQDGDNVVIYGPRGKREYRILRSWGSWSSVESQSLPKTDAVQESQQSDGSASPVSHDSSSEAANSANAKSDLETAESALCGVIAFDAVQIRDQA